MTVVGGTHPLTGMLSSLGALLWCASSAMCLFAAWSLWHRQPRTISRFLLSAGLVSAYLLIDDFFMLHESVAGSRSLGVSEKAVFAVLGLAILGHLFWFRRIILVSNPWLLVLALGMLGASVITDMMQERLLHWGMWRSVLEDGFKWLGISGWFGYHAMVSHKALAGHLGPAPTSEGRAVTQLHLSLQNPAPRIADTLRAFPGAQVLRTFLTSLLVLATMVLACVALEVDFKRLAGDVAALAGIGPLSGALSNLGVLLWCASASVSALTAILLHGHAHRARKRFFTYTAILSAYLMFDDLFLFHEDLSYRYLGIRERYVMLFLGASFATYLAVFSKEILRTRYALLLIAMFCFAGSVAFDALVSQWQLFTLPSQDLADLGEDGLKWLGIAAWCGYIAHASYDALDAAISPDRARAA